MNGLVYVVNCCSSNMIDGKISEKIKSATTVFDNENDAMECFNDYVTDSEWPVEAIYSQIERESPEQPDRYKAYFYGYSDWNGEMLVTVECKRIKQ